jgi:hypothetical protein
MSPFYCHRTQEAIMGLERLPANNPMRRAQGVKTWDDMNADERRAATRAGRAGAKEAYENGKDNPLGLKWDEMTPAEQARRSREFAERKADADATANPRAKRWADMTPEERKHTTPAEALKAYNEANKPLSFEEREQEQARATRTTTTSSRGGSRRACSDRASRATRTSPPAWPRSSSTTAARR